MKQSHNKSRARVVVAGASGFVGWPLIHSLARSHSVVAGRETDRREALAGVEWRICDLFNLRDAEGALAGADEAVYFIQDDAGSILLGVASAFEAIELSPVAPLVRTRR
jgi:nucleoside-diphosphate-sugar epimerase